MADRSFAPVLLAGLVGGGLLAVAGNRDWVEVETSRAGEPALTVFWESTPGLGQMPLAGALGLVTLACWGVLLVTRGRVRRAVAVAAVLAALGGLVTWVIALVSLVDDVTQTLEASAVVDDFDVVRTGWFVAAGIGALLAVLAGAVAVARVPGWPAMGSRYDAPGARAEAEAVRAEQVSGEQDLAEADPTDLWKAIDEGRDPTRGDDHGDAH